MASMLDVDSGSQQLAINDVLAEVQSENWYRCHLSSVSGSIRPPRSTKRSPYPRMEEADVRAGPGIERTDIAPLHALHRRQA
jgi:hypothetical protein